MLSHIRLSDVIPNGSRTFSGVRHDLSRALVHTTDSIGFDQVRTVNENPGGIGWIDPELLGEFC
jgi:hypothetical protein